MILSCADYTWPALDHRGALRLIGQLGFDAVDIGFFAGRTHVRPEEVGESAERWGAVIGERAAAAGLVVADVFGQPAVDFAELAVNHPDPQRRAAALDFVARVSRLASAAGAPGITLLPGLRFGDESYADALHRAADALARCVELGARSGLRVGVEAHVESLVATPESAAELVNLTPGLTLTLDYGHFTVAGFADRQIEPLLPLAGHLQLRGAAAGLLQASAEQNTIDFARVVKAADAAGYRGAVACEYVHSPWYDCDRVDNLTETIWLRDQLRAAGGEVS